MLHKECGWKQGESAMRKGHGRCKRRATQRACASKEGVGFPHKRGKSHLCDPPRGDDRKIYLTPTGPLMEAGSVSDLSLIPSDHEGAYASGSVSAVYTNEERFEISAFHLR